MERVESINIDRLIWCCEDNHISPEELASEVGVSSNTISKLFNREGGLTFNQLKKIADYFGRGVLFFLEEGAINKENVHTPQFRTIANQKPEISTKFKSFVKRVERQRDIYITLREHFDSDDYHQFNPPQLPVNDPYVAAKVVREWLGVTNQKTFEEYRLLIQSKGILVFRSNGYNGKWQISKENPILGFCLYDSDFPVILVKKQEFDSVQNFTLMHELGHILMHKSSSIDDSDDISFHSKGLEREANAFAGYLLVPDEALDSIKDADIPEEPELYDDWLKLQRKELGVSTEVILIRLLNVGRVSQDQYQRYRLWSEQRPQINTVGGGSRSYRHREPRHMFGDNYVKAVLDSLSAKRISLAKASSYLDTLKVKDLHKLEKYYADL